MKTLAIVNGTVYRAGDAKPAKVNVIIRDGKVSAVGPSAAVPRGAEVIDAEGKVVTPGLIDAHTHVGNYGEGTGPPGFDANETGLTEEQLGRIRQVRKDLGLLKRELENWRDELG